TTKRSSSRSRGCSCVVISDSRPYSGVTHRPGPDLRERSAGLAVEGVLAVEAAVLLHLDALAVVRLVLHGDVVPPLALLACQRDCLPLVARHRTLPLCYWLVAVAGLEPATPRL